MKTHDLANALRTFASLLKNGPNVDVNDARIDWILSPTPRSGPQPNDLPIALSALLSLSRIDKQEWIRLIDDLGLPIEIRSRDASRDIVGKVLRVLEKDSEARARLAKKVHSKQTPASPELARALSSLLNF